MRVIALFKSHDKKCAAIRVGVMAKPSVSSKALGATSWSGLPETQQTISHLEELYRYCRVEGRQQGWNDDANGTVGSGRNGPFHIDLFNGGPCLLWQQSYDEGVLAHAEYVSHALEKHDGRA